MQGVTRLNNNIQDQNYKEAILLQDFFFVYNGLEKLFSVIPKNRWVLRQ